MTETKLIVVDDASFDDVVRHARGRILHAISLLVQKNKIDA